MDEQQLKDEAKAAAAKAAAGLDTVTDGVLFKVSQSRYSWAIVGAVIVLAFLAGVIAHAA